MEKNPLKRVEALGQAIWLDYIKRELVTSGKLKKLIVEDGLRGITSNPSIFEKAFSESHDYDQDIRKLTQEGKTVAKIYEVLTQQDVQAAADEFHALYQQTHGQDGYVSLEVNPYLAHDTQGTVEEGRRLWKALNRPNVLIKVPATSAGLPAIQQLITEGISINVTLIFGLSRYQEVIEAYMAGLEARLAAGNAVASLASVASFFLSRIDALLDPLFEKRGAEKALSAALTTALEGQTAIASAKIAYQRYTELFTSARFKKLAEKGAQPQRLLWASTSTKNPKYSDLKYVEALIGPNTVNTLPLETLEAYRDHGNPKAELTHEIDKSKLVFQQLLELNINIDQLTQQLEKEGIDKFSKSYDQLIETLTKKMK